MKLQLNLRKNAEASHSYKVKRKKKQNVYVQAFIEYRLYEKNARRYTTIYFRKWYS